jgi:ATP-binding cassette subfamily A (ABC1) protein 3
MSATEAADSLRAPLVPLATAPPPAGGGGGGGDGRKGGHPPRLHRVRALLHKNRLLKQREWCSLSCGCCGLPPWAPLSLFCEVLLPIGLVLFLWWARNKCVSSGQCVGLVVGGWGAEMSDRAPPTIGQSTECSTHATMKSGAPAKCDHWTSYFQHSRTGICAPRDDGPSGHHLRHAASFLDVLRQATHNHYEGRLPENMNQLKPREQIEGGVKIALSVESPEQVPSVRRMRNWIHENWYPGQFCQDPDSQASAEHTMNCDGWRCDFWLGFNDVTMEKIYVGDDLDKYLEDPSYGKAADQPQLLLAIHFHQIPAGGALGASGEWEYSIRLNFTSGHNDKTDIGSVPRSAGQKVRRLRVHSLEMGNPNEYMGQGFAATQLMLDRYIIGQRTIGNTTSASSINELLNSNGFGPWLDHQNQAQKQKPCPQGAQDTKCILAEPLRYAPNRLEAAPYPIAGQTWDRFYELFPEVFPVIFMLTFLYTQKKVINELIAEKETKVRESLRMLGMGDASLIGSWYLTYALIFGMLCLIFTAVAGLRIFHYSSKLLIFSFFWLWCMSFVAFAFFIQAFFDSARTGGILGMIMSFAQWILYTALKDSIDRPSLKLLMLLPNCAFCEGISILSEFEGTSEGANFRNLSLEVNEGSMLLVLGMLLLDTLWLTLLGLYLDKVLPSTYGVTHVPWFCLLPSYWTSSTLDGVADISDDDATSAAVPEQVGKDVLEPATLALRQQEANGTCVRTLGLRKVYETVIGPKVAVENLTLTMYEGEIFALLGHNGAGKTTTLHMLTGMTAPTAGTAEIYGADIKRDMADIRKHIGVCPQHDVLWLPLTVLEHLTIFARLRGIEAGEIQAATTQLLKDVGLTEKVHTAAGELSGGQKRKLSLCLALIGKVNTVILDEPTSGMDPYSRRSTWNILQDARPGRTMILTTHFMDEVCITKNSCSNTYFGFVRYC